MIKTDRVGISDNHIVEVCPALQFIGNGRQTLVITMLHRRDDTVVRGDDFGLIHRHIADMRCQIIFKAGGEVLC